MILLCCCACVPLQLSIVRMPAIENSCFRVHACLHMAKTWLKSCFDGFVITVGVRAAIDIFSCTSQASDEQLLDVGNRIVKSMRGAGTSVEWNGDPSETIVIKVVVHTCFTCKNHYCKHCKVKPLVRNCKYNQ